MQPRSRRASAIAAGLLLVAAIGWFVRRPQGPPTTPGAGSEEATESIAAPPTLNAPGRAGMASDESAPSGPPSPALDRWRVTGRVKTPDGSPVVGAEIWLTLRSFESESSMGSASTDKDGRFFVMAPALDELDPRARLSASVIAVAIAPRHRASPAGGRAVSASGESREIRFELVCPPGASVTGRVLDARSRPVASAEVRFCSSPAASEHEYSVVHADALGRFAWAIPKAGTYGLDAQKDGMGVAVLSAVDLDPARDTVVPDLLLKGEGWIEGKAVYPDGSPAAWLRVRAAPPKSVEPPGIAGCPAETLGLTSSGTMADARGRFRLAGLKPGRYALVHSTNSGDDAPPSENIHTTGDGDAVVVSTLHRLLLRAVDERGVPVPGAEFHMHGVGPTLDTTEDGYFSRADAIEAVDVGPRMSVTVSASTPDLRSDEASFVIEENQFEATYTLVLKAGSSSSAHVRIAMTAPDGATLGAYRVDVEPVLEFGGGYSPIEFGPEHGDLSPPLKPGRYDLTVRPGRGSPGSSLPFYVAESRRVELKAGETLTVPIRARTGGRLRMVLRERGAKVAELQRVIIHPTTGGEDLTLWPNDCVNPDATGTRLAAFPPDAPIDAVDPIEAGRWSIRIATKGLRPFEKVVDLDVGKITDVEVLVEPE